MPAQDVPDRRVLQPSWGLCHLRASLRATGKEQPGPSSSWAQRWGHALHPGTVQLRVFSFWKGLPCPALGLPRPLPLSMPGHPNRDGRSTQGHAQLTPIQKPPPSSPTDAQAWFSVAQNHAWHRKYHGC